MKKLIAFVLASTPVFAFAQVLTDIDTVAQKATNIGDLIIKIAISLAVLWIIVSVVKYLILGAEDEEARKKGGQSILYGVIGLFVILSIWGLVFLLTNSFRFGQNSTPNSVNNIKLPRPPSVPN
jgi:hypothetical protein